MIYNSLFLIITSLCESYKDKNGKFCNSVIVNVWYLLDMATLHKTKWWSSLINDLWSIIQLCKYVKWIPWPLKHMFRCKSDLSRWNGFKVTAFQNFHYFERRPFWKVGKKHVSHARIPWGFFLVDTGTIRDSKPLESVCLQFCLGSPYIWAILTRLAIIICTTHMT